MALPNAINDREFQKFVDVSPGQTAVRVCISGGLAPETYDEVQVTYPTSDTEVYTFKLASTTVSVVTVTYLDSSKENLVSAVRS